LTKLTDADLNKDSILISIRSGIPKLLRNKDFIILSLSIALLFINASFLFEGANSWVYWLYDDTEHLSIAYNLFHGKGLSRDFIDFGAAPTETNIPHLMLYDGISNSLRSKPPLHLALLGGWLYITGANYTNWFFWGSIFNLILGGISILLFYLFTKRYFGIEIAMYATPVLALMPALLWYSVRIRPDLLAFIFTIMIFYFAARRMTYQNIILVGLLCGLAHLVHPTGLAAVSAVAVYLLVFKRKFRATMVLLATWALVIAPWMVRNYIVFEDATQGLGLPIPRGVSSVLGLISPSAASLNSADVGTIAGIPLSETLIGMLGEFTDLYGMQFFMIFIACSVIAYLSFSAIKRAVSSVYTMILLTLGVIIYVGAITLAITFDNLVFQFFVFFLIPLIIYLAIRFFSHYKDIFTTEGKDIYTILAIFIIISFIPYFMFAQTIGRVVPEVRFVVMSLFMLIPLAIIGIKKLLEVIYISLIRSSSIRIRCVTLSMISILVLFSSIQISTGISSINAFQNPFAESEDMKNVHKWIIENIPSAEKIASNLPHAILLRTGHEAVNFPSAYKEDDLYTRWVIKKFDIDYLVFYHSGDTILDNTYLGNIELRLVFRSEGTQGTLIYKVIGVD
jgi:hypothetical protein